VLGEKENRAESTPKAEAQHGSSVADTEGFTGNLPTISLKKRRKRGSSTKNQGEWRAERAPEAAWSGRRPETANLRRPAACRELSDQKNRRGTAERQKSREVATL